jgi:dTDP-4-amino-4,6-dideoxygalactose transaminase
MSVALYNHPRLYRQDKAAIDAAIARVIGSGRLDWGSEVPAFEAEFAAWNGAGHAVAVHSGTTALKSALLALGVGPDDEVITVPNTDIACSSAIRMVGAEIVWVDIDPASRTMNVAALAAAITSRTKAIMPVDMFGQPADMAAIKAIAEGHGLAIVEDACLALGAEIEGRKVGSFADITCFSFAPSKHLGSFGSGGCCLTENADLAERLRMISAYGQRRTRHYASGVNGLHHETDGLNERLDEVQAAILRAKLPGLAAALAERRAQAGLYADGLEGLGLDLPTSRPGTLHAWRNYVIETDGRDGLSVALGENGIATSITYAPPMHLQPVYRGMNRGRGSYPIAERSCQRLLGLPIGPQITRTEIAEVIAGVRQAMASL